MICRFIRPKDAALNDFSLCNEATLVLGRTFDLVSCYAFSHTTRGEKFLILAKNPAATMRSFNDLFYYDFRWLKRSVLLAEMFHCCARFFRNFFSTIHEMIIKRVIYRYCCANIFAFSHGNFRSTKTVFGLFLYENEGKLMVLTLLGRF